MEPWLESAGRVAAALLVGLLFGLDREIAGKPIGLRTLGLVSLASCGLTLAAAHYGEANGGQGAETVGRAAQGLMAGVGFLGAGVILHTRTARIRGLTTAAMVWFTATLGIACGLGSWPVVIAVVIAAVLLLVLAPPIERALHRRVRGEEPHADPDSFHPPRS